MLNFTTGRENLAIHPLHTLKAQTKQDLGEICKKSKKLIVLDHSFI